MRANYLVTGFVLVVMVCARLYHVFFVNQHSFQEHSVTKIYNNHQTLSNQSSTDDIHPQNSPDCLGLNSDAWTNGPRRGNVDSGMDETFVRKSIVNLPNMFRDGAHSILGASLCHKNSRFRNETEYNLDDERTIRLWAVRLVYLAFHYHQHHWAIPEATRREQGCNLHGSNVGRFDFECPDAKFLLIPLRGHGLGANIRTDIIPALLVALVANRVAVFVNNAPEGDEDVTNPWPLASCDRKDYQCFYLAESPCTLTLADIRDAHVFHDRVDFRRALKRSVLPTGYDHKKVWLFKHTSGHTVQLPELAVARLQNYSNILLEQLPAKDDRLPTLRKAIEAIGDEDPPREGLNYAMANLKVHHALGFYAMRPNIPNAIKLERILQEVWPDTLDPEQTVGLPVRGSDKCRKESECINFELHMQAAAEVWSKHWNETHAEETATISPTVLFTTESRQAVAEQRQFLSNSSQWYKGHNLSFSFDFVVNDHDVTPDTGYLPHVVNEETLFTADDAMLSAVSSFQLQLMARTSVGNCCSHFHHLLNDFLIDGCGATHEHQFMCLQESADPLLHVCCAWHNDCKRAKALKAPG